MSAESSRLRRLWRRLLALVRRQKPKIEAPSPRSSAPAPPVSAQASATAAAAAPRATFVRQDTVALHVGIDFGTRFTKVCFRDLGRDRSELVTFAPPGETPALQTALLSSRVVIRDGGVVAALNDAEWASRSRSSDVSIDFIKIRLSQLDVPPGRGEWVPDPLEVDGASQSIETLATFFLARVISRARRWIETNRHDLIAGRRVQWSYSVGLPVKYIDSPAIDRFERVLGAAATLANRGVPEELTLPELAAAYPELVRARWIASGSVQPEIAAAVRSFIASPRAMEGVYLFVDIGAGTVDGASFRFHRPPEERAQLNFYWGDVQPLGVAAAAAQLARSTNLSADTVEEILYRKDGRAAFGVALSGIERLINRLVAGIILHGKQADRLAWEDGLEQLFVALQRRRRTGARPNRDVPLFIGGGGSVSSFYREAIMSTYKANNLYAANVRQYALEELLVPDDLEMHGIPSEEFHRFAVAYGLSIPKEEAADIGLPSTDTDLPLPRRPRPPDGPSYEDTKDLE